VVDEEAEKEFASAAIKLMAGPAIESMVGSCHQLYGSRCESAEKGMNVDIELNGYCVA
jgi:hypothetical protein